MLANSSKIIGGVAFVDRSRLPLFAGYKQIDVIFLITIASILIICILIFFVSRAITKPILELATAVNQIKDLNDIRPVNIRCHDYETSVLQESINHLLQTIDTQIKEIEKKDKQILRASLMERVYLETQSARPDKDDLMPEIIGVSHAISLVKEEAKRASMVEADVLLVGETGTGKQLLAEAIHRLSPRKNGPFVSINCGALDENLLLDALFGHVKGAFSEAKTDRKGAFLSADGGTLFLDEIGTASLKVQQALLRAISTRKVRQLGSDEERDVNVRLIAATNQDLKRLVEEGRFREDLYYRLNVISIHVPPLRERKEDIPLLVEHFIEKYNVESGKRVEGISEEALEILMEHDWPGNVRELRNAVERLMIMVSKDVVEISDIENTGIIMSKAKEETCFSYTSLKQARDAFEREFILRKLKENNWNMTKTAEIIGIERSNLYKKIKSLGIILPKEFSEN
jgi:transcriptional regulator with PAS, ATPase and Fis domain